MKNRQPLFYFLMLIVLTISASCGSKNKIGESESPDTVSGQIPIEALKSSCQKAWDSEVKNNPLGLLLVYSNKNFNISGERESLTLESEVESEVMESDAVHIKKLIRSKHIIPTKRESQSVETLLAASFLQKCSKQSFVNRQVILDQRNEILVTQAGTFESEYVKYKLIPALGRFDQGQMETWSSKELGINIFLKTVTKLKQLSNSRNIEQLKVQELINIRLP